MIAFNAAEVRNQLQTNGVIETGATVSRNKGAPDNTKVYFIGSVNGTAIIMKDKDGVTKLTAGTNVDFQSPWRFDEGFEIIGTNLTVRFVEIVVIADPE